MQIIKNQINNMDKNESNPVIIPVLYIPSNGIKIIDVSKEPVQPPIKSAE